MNLTITPNLFRFVRNNQTTQQNPINNNYPNLAPLAQDTVSFGVGEKQLKAGTRLSKQFGMRMQSTLEEPFKMSKVFVGSYPTIEQAIQAQNRLMNTNISVSPFVKEVNGSYVLQAGSYANAHKAEAVAKEISAAGFQARVVKE